MDMKINQAQHGFSLMEVLIALLILSVGLLGLVALQVSGLRSVNNSTSYTQAALAVNDLAERMRANPIAVDNGDFAGFDSAAINCAAPPAPYCSETSGAAAVSCTPDELAAYDLFAWFCGESTGTNMPDTLDLAQATITCFDRDVADALPCSPGSPQVITLQWQELNRVEEGGAAAQVPQSVSMRVQP